MASVSTRGRRIQEKPRTRQTGASPRPVWPQRTAPAFAQRQQWSGRRPGRWRRSGCRKIPQRSAAAGSTARQGRRYPNSASSSHIPPRKKKYARAFCHGKAKGKGEYGHGNACHGEKGCFTYSFSLISSALPIFSAPFAILMPISAPSADTATTAKVIPTAAKAAPCPPPPQAGCPRPLQAGYRGS